MEVFALTLLLLFSLIGFIAIFFTTFGTLIILIGALLFGIMTEFTILPLSVLAILAGLYFLGEVFEYLCVIVGAKKLGASNMAVVGALLGGIIGALVGVNLAIIGLIPATFLGIFSGAFFVEYLIQRDLVKSLKAGLGGVLGRIGSVFVKLIIAGIMFGIIVMRFLKAG